MYTVRVLEPGVHHAGHWRDQTAFLTETHQTNEALICKYDFYSIAKKCLKVVQSSII
jgi:hypothetical protein